MIGAYTSQDLRDWRDHVVTQNLVAELKARIASAKESIFKLKPGESAERALDRIGGLVEAYEYVILLPERMKQVRQNREVNNG